MHTKCIDSYVRNAEQCNAKMHKHKQINMMLTMIILSLLLLCTAAFPVFTFTRAQLGRQQSTVLSSAPKNEVEYDCIVICSGKFSPMCLRYQYSQWQLTNLLHISSSEGMSGLCSSNKLAQQGKRVLMVEAHSIPGGYTTNFYIPVARDMCSTSCSSILSFNSWYLLPRRPSSSSVLAKAL